MIPDFAALMPAIRAHAAAAAPREACGVLIVAGGELAWRPCRNAAVTPLQHFVIDAAELAAAEDDGELVAIVHSHVGRPPAPSQADRAGCEASGLPWLIVNHPLGTHALVGPCGWRAPLVGREFCYGVHDCYAIVRDHYLEACGITLADYPRDWQWWLQGGDLYRDNFAAEGFVAVCDGLRPHDLLLMQVASPVPNHAAVYLGDGLILHHVQGRLSSRDVYGGYWRKHTVLQLRHRTLC